MKIHVTRPGDTLWVLAQKYNVPAERLKEANPELGDQDELRPGLKVRVPTGKVPVIAPGKENRRREAVPQEFPMFYPHVPGESFSFPSYDDADLADEGEDWNSSELGLEFDELTPSSGISAPPYMPYAWQPYGWWPPYPSAMIDPAAWPMMAGPECSGFVPYHPHVSIHAGGWPAPWPAPWPVSWQGGAAARRNMKESSSREG